MSLLVVFARNSSTTLSRERYECLLINISAFRTAHTVLWQSLSKFQNCHTLHSGLITVQATGIGYKYGATGTGHRCRPQIPCHLTVAYRAFLLPYPFYCSTGSSLQMVCSGVLQTFAGIPAGFFGSTLPPQSSASGSLPS